MSMNPPSGPPQGQPPGGGWRPGGNDPSSQGGHSGPSFQGGHSGPGPAQGPPPGWQGAPTGAGGHSGPGQPNMQPGPHQQPGQQWGQQQPGQPGQPNQPNQPGSKPKRKPLIIGIISAVVVLALIVGGVLIYRNVQERRAEERRQAALTSETEAARGAVQDYLGALESADAEVALGLAEETTEGPLLTNDVLAESNEAGGVTDPQVTSAEMQQLEDDTVPRGKVTATYTVGGRQTEEPVTFDVVNTPEGWRLTTIAAPVEVGSGAKTINGQEVSQSSVLAFPGSYTVESPNDRVEFTNGEFAVSDPHSEDTTWSADSRLTDAGNRQVVDAGKRALDACLSKKELAPADCPMIQWRESNGISVDTDSIEYTLQNDPWADVNLNLGSDSSVTAVVSPDIELYADATQNGSSGYIQESQTVPTQMTADISGPDIKVTWGF